MSTQTVSPSVPAQTFRAALHNLFPAAPRAANALADCLVSIQQHSLWDIEDLAPADSAEALLKTVRLSHALIFNLQCFRLATAVNPELHRLRTEEVDRSISDMEKLAVRLSATCRELVAAGDLSVETLVRQCNSLDGTLVNLQTECQFFTAVLQQPGAAAA